MKGAGQAQLPLIPVNTDTAQRGCHDKVLHKSSWLHHKKCGMFKMQPGRWDSKITLSLWFLPDQKYLARRESCNTPTGFDSRKMANQQVWPPLNEFLQCWTLLGLAAGQQMGFPSKGQGEQHRHPWVVQEQSKRLCCLCRKLCSSCRAVLAHRNSSYHLPWPAWEGR